MENEKKLKINLLGDRVIIVPPPAEKETSSGLIVPNNSRGEPFVGKVVAIGSDVNAIKPTLNIGDSVVYDLYAGTDFVFHGVKYILMRIDNVIGVLE